MADLPDKLAGVSDEILVKVEGDQSSSFDTFWLVWRDEVWKETTAPGIEYQLDSATMPHVLIREEDGSFSFKELEWVDRSVGDDDTAPLPSFIGKSLSDIFFYKNRLGFLSGDNVILSAVGDYYNFFPTTILDVLDSDSIDICVDTNKATRLSYAIPTNDSLLLFSDKAQFTLKGSDILGASTASITQTTSYDFNSLAEPITVGANVYFTLDSSRYSSVMEYTLGADILASEATCITEHVPSYIPKGIKAITGDAHLNLLFALSQETPNTLYYYKYYWQGDTKAQSAWSKWTFSGSIYHIFILESFLYLLIDRGEGVNLERINLEALPYDDRLYLDNGSIDYDMEVLLTKWAVKNQKNVTDPIANLRLKTLTLTSTQDSQYTLEVLNNRRSRVYDGISLKDKKVVLLGKPENVAIKVTCPYATGCQINTVSYEGTYISRSKTTQ
jgi:hypothetical protein